MSSHSTSDDKRRAFLKFIGGGAILMPVFSLLACSKQDAAAPASMATPPEPAPPAAQTAAPAEPVAVAPTTPAAADSSPPSANPPSAAPAPTGNLPHLDPNNATAKALGYHQDSASVPSAQYPQHMAGQACRKCAQFRGAAADAWGPCNIFTGNQVNANGWCTAFVAKA